MNQIVNLQALAAAAKLIVCADEEFEAAVKRAQSDAGHAATGVRAKFPGASGPALFERCLAMALSEGWIDPLMREIISARLDGGKILTDWYMTQAGLPPPPNLDQQQANRAVILQRNMRAVTEYGEPARALMGIEAGMRYTAQVIVTGPQPVTGTGFLIGPDILITAWHVVDGLLQPTAHPAASGLTHQAIPGSVGRIQILFDKVRLPTGRGSELTLGPGTKVEVAQNWFEGGALPPMPINQLPAPHAFANHWDYALIRLARSVGRERGFIPFELSDPPPTDGRLWIFQFPLAWPLQYDTDLVKGSYGHSRERFYYDRLNSDYGSSGGPCFDIHFRLVGMHLAHALNIGGGPANFAVPITKILNHISTTIGGLPAPVQGVAALHRLRNRPLPVVGRWDFQNLVWTELVPGTNRVLLVSGPLGRGKAYLADILDSMLPPSGHLVVTVSADGFAKEPAPNVHAILSAKLGPLQSVAPTLAPIAPSVSALRSTPAALTKDHLAETFVEHADQRRAGRLVWIVVDALDQVTIDGSDAGEYLYQLYRSTAKFPWLRFVLLGFRGDVAAFGDAQKLVGRYSPAALTVQEVAEHIRFQLSEHKKDWGDQAIAFQARQLFDAAGDPNQAGHAQSIAERLMEFEVALVRSNE
jgi:hypothetical protein